MENTRLVGQALADAADIAEIEFPGLNDHIVQGFLATVPEAVLSLPALDERAFCFVPRSGPSRSHLFWEVLPGGVRGVTLVVWAMGEKRRGDSAVVLHRDRERPQASVHVRRPFTDQDLEVVAEQLDVLGEVLERLLHTPRAALKLTPENFRAGQPLWTGAVRSAAERTVPYDRVEVNSYVYPLGTVDHESGTLPLGVVLDMDGRLPALPRLSVLGPATFPRSGAANPSFTTLALSMRHADDWSTWAGCS
jgi:choline dehydrogenase-like flavoprotein